mmetsp:Transcript_23709/g.50740  ORF Transcript_23709/g.50740 Transcript_23709/m.50740 type:complete len:1105 (-) Transcript_23709:47-3361(-)
MAADIVLSQSAGVNGREIDAICIGSGRFLRSVLVPLLSSRQKPAVFQTRGRTFLDSFRGGGGVGGDDGVGGGSSGNDSTPPSLRYPVDTIQFDGTTTTSHVEIYAAGTLGTPDGKSRLVDGLLSNMDCINVIGVGVTEKGLQSAENRCMLDLTELLYKVFAHKMKCANPNRRVCVINTDNVPNNGGVIRGHVLSNAKGYDEENRGFIEFVKSRVAFLDTMVDRITSSRPGSGGLVPLCEPLPNKALVICDEGRDLPPWMDDEDFRSPFGVKIRHSPRDLESDIFLKLRVANGTHTAVAHAMALLSLVNTEALCGSSSSSSIILSYLDSLYRTQVLPAAVNDGISAEETDATWDDWRKRLRHPHFGLSTFFITQNGAAKLGIRLGPTIKSLAAATDYSLSVSMAFAVAAILRFLTPASSANGRATNLSERVGDAKRRGAYVGWLDVNRDDNDTDDDWPPSNSPSDTVTYADGLRYNLAKGWYEFRCDCPVTWRTPSSSSNELNRLQIETTLPEALSKFAPARQPCAYEEVVRLYLLHPQGGNLQVLLEGKNEKDEMMRAKKFDVFVGSVSTLYARMVGGDSIIFLLQEMMEKQHVYTDGFATSCNRLDSIRSSEQDGLKPLHHCPNPIPETSSLMADQNGLRENEVCSVVFSEVRGQRVIDLHTHLLPPSHGALCLWGIDELLTYHYLVAEFFQTAPANISPDGFYKMSKKEQADLIWDALFIQRSPISEATRGVLTTLVALGLEAHVRARDLDAIRSYYETFRGDGLNGIESFVERVYQISGVRYAIMTNIPFDATETQHWRPKKKAYPSTFKSALRVDPLLAGDKDTVEAALKASGYGTTLADARQYLHDWCDTMQPEYMMASTPHNFYLPPSEGGTLAGAKKIGVNESTMRTPFAFTDLSADECKGCEDTDNVPSMINETSDFLTDVLMPVCEERNLPLALKIGAHRAVNPGLLSAGDGMVAFADAGSLARLCGKFPKVRFLATFLSRVNQHEACVLASKFRNLHIYGCWWFCNNPSIIEEITRMRVEMLGTAFTAQHSDARVMDQLIYKWAHSRAVIAKILAEEYQKSISSGWKLTREEIRRDVRRLLGGAYEDFMKNILN